MKRKPQGLTLAAELDRMRWDYSPGTDRSFLLASVERMFASVAWEITPQHLTPMAERPEGDSRDSNTEDFETQPLECLTFRRRS